MVDDPGLVAIAVVWRRGDPAKVVRFLETYTDLPVAAYRPDESGDDPVLAALRDDEPVYRSDGVAVHVIAPEMLAPAVEQLSGLAREHVGRLLVERPDG